MIGYRNTSNVAKKAAVVAQKMSSRAHGEFYIHNRNEITTWMGHSFNTKSTKSRATFLREQRLF